MKVVSKLAALHKATEASFLKYGHIYFFIPLALDHFSTLYGQIMAGVTVVLSCGALAYTIFSDTDA